MKHFFIFLLAFSAFIFPGCLSSNTGNENNRNIISDVGEATSETAPGGDAQGFSGRTTIRSGEVLKVRCTTVFAQNAEREILCYLFARNAGGIETRLERKDIAETLKFTWDTPSKLSGTTFEIVSCTTLNDEMAQKCRFRINPLETSSVKFELKIEDTSIHSKKSEITQVFLSKGLGVGILPGVSHPSGGTGPGLSPQLDPGQIYPRAMLPLINPNGFCTRGNTTYVYGLSGSIYEVNNDTFQLYAGISLPAPQPRFNLELSNLLRLTCASDSLIVTDISYHKVYRIFDSGAVSLIAGNGTPGYCGDNVPGDQSCLWYPQGTALATDGSIYIADSFNHMIRKVDNLGVITTVAGNGADSGQISFGNAKEVEIGVPMAIQIAADGSLYFIDARNSVIYKLREERVEVVAVLNTEDSLRINPVDILLHQSLLYVSLAGITGGNQILACSLSGTCEIAVGTPTTDARAGMQLGAATVNAQSATISSPRSLALSENGNLLFGLYLNQTIRELLPDGTMSLFAGYPYVFIPKAPVIYMGF